MASKIDDWKNLSYDEKLKWRESTQVDCSFIVGVGVNTRTIGAHKSILTCASEVFNSMFNGNYKEADTSFNIPLPNVSSYLNFKVMLEYIYYTKTDSIQLLNLERTINVAYLADYYLLDELLNVCHYEIGRKATEKNNHNFYDFLQVFEYHKKTGRDFKFRYNDVILPLSDAIRYISYKPEEILTTTSIYDLEPSYFYDFLILLAARLKESVKFCLIENYAKIHGLKMDKFSYDFIEPDDSEQKSETRSNGKSLKEMFDLIKFSNMTSSEFAYGPAVSKIWTVPHEEQLFCMLQTMKL